MSGGEEDVKYSGVGFVGIPTIFITQSDICQADIIEVQRADFSRWRNVGSYANFGLTLVQQTKRHWIDISADIGPMPISHRRLRTN